jgi:AcrR family transcriptional regulator
MPRAFQPDERDEIREALLAAGGQLFGRRGLRRTTVQDLTRAAGIAQGSFYSFFRSKEDLFFELLEREEGAFFARLLGELQSRPLSRRRLKQLVLSGFEQFRAHPFLGSLFGSGEYEALRRGVPAARMRRHVAGESELVAEVVGRLAAAGDVRSLDPQVLVGLLQAFFLLHVRRDEFDPAVFPEMLDLLAGLVADYVATKGARNVSA